MFLLLKYRLLRLMRNKTLLFWNLVFPLSLITFFGMALPNSMKTITFEAIPVAIVESTEFKEDTAFQKTIEAVSTGDDALLATTYTDEDDALQLLKDGEVDGIILKADDFQVTVAQTGLNQTILQSFMDEYKQKSSMIHNLLQKNIEPAQIMQQMSETKSYIEETTNENNNLSSVYFFTIIAMCCLYGGFLSLSSMRDVQANLSSVAARNSLAPTHKIKLLLANFIVDYIADYIILMIILAYMIFVIHIDFGNTLIYTLITIAGGVLAGNAIGTLIGISSTKSADSKTAILTTVTLSLSFLSGMMIVTIKYFIDVYAPIISLVNPANMITDALYAVYYYGPSSRYMFNIASLFLFAGVCYVISYFVLRRKQYASL